MRKLIYILLTTSILLLLGCQSKSEEVDNVPEAINNDTNRADSDDDIERNADTESTTPLDDQSDDSDVSTDWFYAEALSNLIPYMTDDHAELSERSYNFIVENHNLFPANEEKYIKEVDELAESIDVRLLNKNLSPHLETIVKLEGYVVEVEETTEEGETISGVNLLDDDWNNHTIIYFKGTGDILEDDTVEVTALPVAKYNYETLDGGSQNSIIYFGSHIRKK